jgi:hypothetical protein
MSGPMYFILKLCPAKGHPRGLLPGVKMETFEVEKVESAHFFLGCLVRNRLTNYRFWFLDIYGPAHHDLSKDFI